MRMMIRVRMMMVVRVDGDGDDADDADARHDRIEPAGAGAGRALACRRGWPRTGGCHGGCLIVVGRSLETRLAWPCMVC